MEKKPNSRSNQASGNKVVATESRKSQDASGKQWPKNGRRREPINNQPKADPTRQKATTRSNNQFNNEKRSRAPRTGADASQRPFTVSTVAGSSQPATANAAARSRLDSADELEASVAGAVEAELNSVYLPGSRKQNLSHLLNFHYGPSANDSAAAAFHQRGGGHRAGTYARHSKYNKEKYLQATCQFVVRAGKSADLAPYVASPDLLVEWQWIEQVHIESVEEPQCPICLYPPVAGKMTRCGHVFCWPCILHYLALSDKTWRKCPICYEAVHVGDLKSAISKPHRMYNVGEYVTLQLMCREKTSMCVKKAKSSMASCKSIVPHLRENSQSEVVYSKLLLADNNEIMSIIERERNELKSQLSFEGHDCPETVFVQQALDLLQTRENEVLQDTSNQSTDVSVELEQLHLNPTAAPFVPRQSTVSESTSEGDLIEDTNLSVTDIDINPTVSDLSHFYFYQANDGQHLYLHTMNVRMLQAMYGSLEWSPQIIRGNIVQRESCSMSEQLRKRLKYLQHLPETCQFDVVEIQFDKNIISPEVFDGFKEELQHRQKSRQRRAREERIRERHINEVMDRQMGKALARSANIDIESTYQFPNCGSQDSPPLFQEDPPLPGTSNSQTNNETASTSIVSFAKMLTVTEKQKQEPLWPTLGQAKTATAAPNKPMASIFGPTFGTTYNDYASNRSNAARMSESDGPVLEDSEDEFKPPERSSLSSVIAEALLKKSASSSNAGNAEGGQGGRKKKKKGKVLLML